MNAQTQRNPTLKRSLALLWLATIASTAHANTYEDVLTESVNSRWQVTLPLYLTAGSYYQSNGETTNTFQAVAASAEILVSSPVSPWSSGLFVGRVYSPDSERNGAVFAGGLVKHQISEWDTTVSLINYDPPGDTGQWKYFGRVRYRFADDHKLGVEVMGSLRDPSTPNLMLGYYGTISRAFSVKLVVGSKAKTGNERVVRTELVWQFN